MDTQSFHSENCYSQFTKPPSWLAIQQGLRFIIKIYLIISDPRGKSKLNKRKQHLVNDGQEPGPSNAKQQKLTEPGKSYYC